MISFHLYASTSNINHIYHEALLMPSIHLYKRKPFILLYIDCCSIDQNIMEHYSKPISQRHFYGKNVKGFCFSEGNTICFLPIKLKELHVDISWYLVRAYLKYVHSAPYHWHTFDHCTTLCTTKNVVIVQTHILPTYNFERQHEMLSQSLDHICLWYRMYNVYLSI